MENMVQEHVRKRAKCPLCGFPIRMEDFTNEASYEEFLISGMCPSCQDDVFCSDQEDDRR